MTRTLATGASGAPRAPRKTWLPAVAAAAVLAGVELAPLPARALEGLAAQFAETLDERQQRLFTQVVEARAAFDKASDAYWSDVSDKRAARRAKKAMNQPLGIEDYVTAFPPEYAGPSLTTELAKAWSEFQARNAPTPRDVAKPTPTVATVADALAAAKQAYGFEPARVSEREFKLRYAREALALGLSRDQVVRIYALETGGIGTADMQAGIHPIRKTGTPISTALGYAQLLAANSLDETAKHGPTFIARLQALAARPGLDAARAQALKAKVAALRKMVAYARSLPQQWDQHVANAGTPKGLGIHALNLDGDIGPWLQVVKLKGLKDLADKSGRTRLAGNEIELMNLAGPATGLEMMAGIGRTVPTPNFFSRGAYGRNSVVRGKTSVELLDALNQRMDENSKHAGTVEFVAVFDEIARERRPAQ